MGYHSSGYYGNKPYVIQRIKDKKYLNTKGYNKNFVEDIKDATTWENCPDYLVEHLEGCRVMIKTP